MSEVAISFGDSMAILSPRGAALISLVLSGVKITPRPAPDSNPYHGVTLAPWPNRISDGLYVTEAGTHQLAINDPLGHALHGLVFDQLFQLEEHSTSSASFEFELDESPGYPWKLLVRTQYSLDERGLDVRISATNLSDTRAPIGLGTHPFFRIDDQSRLVVHASEVSIHDSRMIPVSSLKLRPRRGLLGATFRTKGAKLDTQFYGTEIIAATLRTNIGEFQIHQVGAPWLMVYTDDNFLWEDGSIGAIAIEPQTCPANAFNTGEGLVLISGGQTHNYSWGIRKSS